MESLESSGDRAPYNFISSLYSLQMIAFFLYITLSVQLFCYRSILDSKRSQHLFTDYINESTAVLRCLKVLSDILPRNLSCYPWQGKKQVKLYWWRAAGLPAYQAVTMSIWKVPYLFLLIMKLCSVAETPLSINKRVKSRQETRRTWTQGEADIMLNSSLTCQEHWILKERWLFLISDLETWGT